MSVCVRGAAATVGMLALVACGSTSGSGLTITPTSLTFSADRSGSLPSPQSIHITVSDTNAAYVIGGYPAGVTPPSWLSLSLTGAGSSWDLHAAITSTALDPGMYSVTVRVVIARSDESVIAYRDAQLTYTVANTLTASPSSLAFTQVAGGPPATAQSVTVAGTNGLAWTASANQGWVTLSASSGTTPSTVNVTADGSGLAAGNYSARITFSTAGSTASVDVSLAVSAPALQASSASLVFSAVNGAPIATQSLSISMNDGSAVNWSATTGSGWLLLSKTSGTTPDTVTVSLDPSIGPLASGSYESTVTFTSSAPGAIPAATVNVHLTLTKAAFSLSPTTLVLGGSNGRDLTSKSVLLGLNTGTNAYAWTATPSATWMSASSTSTTVSATAVPVDVTPDRTGLTGGTRTGTLTFSATVNGDAVSASLPVTFNLDAHKLLVARNGVALVKTPALTNLTRTVHLTDNLGAATPWTASADQTWLSVTPASGTGSTDLVLTADATSLPADSINLATVSIATTDATVELADVVQVGLWVGSATPGPVAVSGSFTELVADPVRPYLYVHGGGTDLSIYNVHTGASVATVANVAANLGAMAVASDGTTLFAVDRTNFNVVPVNLTARTVGTGWSLSTRANTEPRLAYTRTNGLPILAATDGAIHKAADGSVLLTFAVPSQVSPTMLVAASLEGNAFCAGGCRSLSYSAVAGGTFSVGTLSGYGGSRDTTLAADGAHVYGASGAPYNCTSEDTSTGQSAALGSNYPYPGNVEVGPDARIYCGRYATLSTDKDVYVFDAGGTQLGTVRVASTSGLGLLDRQLAISGDGLRVIGLDPALKIVTAP